MLTLFNRYDNFMRTFDRQLDRLEKDLDSSTYRGELWSYESKNYAVKETEESHIIWVALPGYDKETVKILVEDFRLSIVANGSDSPVSVDHNFKFKLPKGLDLKNIDAQMRNGVLCITLKKLGEKKEQSTVEVKIK